MQTDSSLEKTLMLGKVEGKMGRERQRMRWLDGITDWGQKYEQTLGDGEGGRPGVQQSMGSKRVKYDLVTEQLSICPHIFVKQLYFYNP